MANTPNKGKTWLFHEHVVDPPDYEARVWIHSPDNPYLPPSEVKKLERDPTVAAIRLRGEFVATEGRVWPQFTRQLHVLPASTRALIPAAAPRFRAIDFGVRDPHACLWGALLKSRLELPTGRILPERSLIVYRERYATGLTLAEHVEWYRQAEGWVKGEDGKWSRGPSAERIELTWADPEDAQQVLSLNRDHGITAVKATKAREAGHDAVGEWLTPDTTGDPKLLVLDDCHNTIREWSDYVWVDRTKDGAPVEVASGRSDHTCDCVRYLVMGVRSYL